MTLQFSSDVKGDSVGHVTSSLVLKHIPSDQRRHVYHIQYLDWTDESCLPSEDSFLGKNNQSFALIIPISD